MNKAANIEHEEQHHQIQQDEDKGKAHFINCCCRKSGIFSNAPEKAMNMVLNHTTKTPTATHFMAMEKAVNATFAKRYKEHRLSAISER